MEFLPVSIHGYCGDAAFMVEQRGGSLMRICLKRVVSGVLAIDKEAR